MRCFRFNALVAGLVAFGLPARAQQQPPVPVRPLGAIIATSVEPLGSVNGVRPLSDGRVLVNDPSKRRLVLFDSALKHVVVVADTTSGTSKAYGDGLNGLMPFFGDSTLILDQIPSAILVIDPGGKIARILAMPRTQVTSTVGAGSITTALGIPLGFDQAGHLLFREPSLPFTLFLPQGFIGDTLMHGPDSIAIVRIDMTTRKLDTVTMLKAPVVRQAMTRQDNGRGGFSSVGRQAFNPIPAGDDWTLLNDGTVAVLRASDYRVDWIRPDRTKTSGPKVPTQWVRLTDSMKVAIIDSIRAGDVAARSRDSAATAARIAAMSPAKRDSLARDSVNRVAAAAGRGGRGGAMLAGLQQRAIVEPSDLPDYRPAFTSGSTRADAEGNVWVRVNPAGLAPGVFDVINRKGERIDRVEIPGGTTLVGFGPGVAYLTSRVGGTMQLAKARIY